MHMDERGAKLHTRCHAKNYTFDCLIVLSMVQISKNKSALREDIS